MPVPITALYLAIFALFAAGLYIMCGRIRGPERIYAQPAAYGCQSAANALPIRPLWDTGNLLRRNKGRVNFLSPASVWDRCQRTVVATAGCRQRGLLHHLL